MVPAGIPFKVLRGPLKGKKLIIGAPAGEGKGISVIFNLSEPRRLKLTSDLILKDDICFDIGANVGIYSLLFAEYAKTTYAFEPLPRNLSFLYRMLESNKVNNVVIVPCAVADVDGLTWFEAAESNAEGKVTENGTLPVPVVTLDTFIKKSIICPVKLG